jgi:TusA-related sulfurtransferase
VSEVGGRGGGEPTEDGEIAAGGRANQGALSEVGGRGGGEPTADLELDCRGLRCPLPVIELGRRLADVPVGGTIAVVATDLAARVDVPAWCRMRAQEYLGEDVAPDGTPRFVVRRVS